jgi:hypothetical protein
MLLAANFGHTVCLVLFESLFIDYRAMLALFCPLSHANFVLMRDELLLFGPFNVYHGDFIVFLEQVCARDLFDELLLLGVGGHPLTGFLHVFYSAI